MDAAGLWAPQVARMVGAWLASTPVDHQHAPLLAVPGSELPTDLPCFRDPELLVYGRSEAGGLLLGGYEPDPPSRWEDGVPWDHGSRSLPPDEARYLPLVELTPRVGSRSSPMRSSGGIVCHPDAMTPDANPLVGPWPGRRGFWVAAGLSLNGFGGAGGTRPDGGRLDDDRRTGRRRVARTARGASRTRIATRMYAAAGAREAYRYYYRQRFPHDTDTAGRPRRLSALHGRLQDARRRLRDQARLGASGPVRARRGLASGRRGRPCAGDSGRPAWFDLVGEEHRAIRERVGLLDLSSFGKLLVEGPGATALLDRIVANRLRRSVAITYSQLLDSARRDRRGRHDRSPRR